MDSLASQAKSGDLEALAALFHQYEDRLRRMVEIRMDPKLLARIDPSDVLQEAYLDLVQRLPSFASRDEEMSMFVWMRLVTSEKLLQLRRQHVDAQKRAIGREVSINQKASDQSSACLADRLYGHFSSAGNKLVRDEMRQVLMNTLEAMEEIDREIILTQVSSANRKRLGRSGAAGGDRGGQVRRSLAAVPNGRDPQPQWPVGLAKHAVRLDASDR